jgi:hypothetical protein
MDTKDIQKLPLEQQVEELRTLRIEFEEERANLKNEIVALEDSKKEKEGYAKALVSDSKLHKEAEISVIVSSIARVRNSLDLKSRELDFAEKAVQNAEKLLNKAQGEVSEKELRAHDLLIEQLLVEQDKEKDLKGRLSEEIEVKEVKKEVDEKKTLEEEILGTKIKEEAKPQADYMTKPEGVSGDKLYDTNDTLYDTNAGVGEYKVDKEEGHDYITGPKLDESELDKNKSIYRSRDDD